MAMRNPFLLFLLVCFAVAFAACGTRSAITIGSDAASKAAADALPTADGLGPDLAASPDARSGDDPLDPGVLADALATSSPDSGLKDSFADELGRDLVTVADSAPDAGRADLPADAAPRDVRSDAAADLQREAGLDVPPFVVDGALAGFCSGDSPRLVINGVASSPTVSGKIIPYDCCDGGEFDATSPNFSLPIVVAWRVTAGSVHGYPASVDLADSNSGWAVRLYAGCDPVMSSCSSPGDGYTSGLEGTLLVARASWKFDMSLCLHVQEPSSTPHTIIHSMDLYAPHVMTN
jgi:hypothetical protein